MKRVMNTTVLLVIALILMWGFSWSAIKIGLEYAPPILYAGVRTLCGGTILLLVALWRRQPLAFRRNWRIYLTSSILNVILFFGLQTGGLYFLPSGLLSVLVYLQPILVGVFAWLWLHETLSIGKILGLILGFLGVVSVGFGGLVGQASFIGVVLAILAAVSWAAGTVYLKMNHHRVEMIWLIAVQFVIGGVALLGTGSVFEQWSAVRLTSAFWLSMSYSALIGVSLSWLVWFRLLRHGEISKISAYIFFVPLLSVLIGVWFLHEQFSPLLIVGLVLIIGGIYLVNRRARLQPDRPAAGSFRALDRESST